MQILKNSLMSINCYRSVFGSASNGPYSTSHYICDVIERKLVQVFYLEGEENPADLFTKNLGLVKFAKFRQMLGLTFAA